MRVGPTCQPSSPLSLSSILSSPLTLRRPPSAPLQPHWVALRTVRRRVPLSERSRSCRRSHAAFSTATRFPARPVEMHQKGRKRGKRKKKYLTLWAPPPCVNHVIKTTQQNHRMTKLNVNGFDSSMVKDTQFWSCMTKIKLGQ